MKRQAYGFRDTEFLELKILALHETKYVLIGNELWFFRRQATEKP